MKFTIAKRQKFDYLFAEIIESESLTELDIQDKIKFTEIDYEASYRLLCLDLPFLNELPNEHILHEISDSLIKSYTTIYKNKVYILLVDAINLTDIQKKQNLNFTFTVLSGILKRYNARCGISLPFCKLKQMSEAYLQATSALDLGNFPKKNDGYFDYNDYRIFHLLTICNDKTPIKNFSNPKLLKIYENENNKKADRLQILRTYLENNCKITETALELHMHRNSIIYHIQQIEELYQINTNDFKERLDLMLTFEIMDFINYQTQG
ncbi:PucR family transcriptional regulator [Parasporobacterium paucivorans]|nr:PucR family transcriptional regulator [Parasporobacterium paucivorans]